MKLDLMEDKSRDEISKVRIPGRVIIIVYDEFSL
jgi:hypothetical protein